VTVVATGLDGGRPARSRATAERREEEDVFQPPSFLTD
jgi:hypothetical protein